MKMQRFSMKRMTVTLASAFAIGVIIVTGGPVIARDMTGTFDYHSDAMGHATAPPLKLAKSLSETRSSKWSQGPTWDQSAGSAQDKSADVFGGKESSSPQGYAWIEHFFKSGDARNPFLRK